MHRVFEIFFLSALLQASTAHVLSYPYASVPYQYNTSPYNVNTAYATPVSYAQPNANLATVNYLPSNLASASSAASSSSSAYGAGSAGATGSNIHYSTNYARTSPQANVNYISSNTAGAGAASSSLVGVNGAGDLASINYAHNPTASIISGDSFVNSNLASARSAGSAAWHSNVGNSAARANSAATSAAIANSAARTNSAATSAARASASATNAARASTAARTSNLGYANDIAKASPRPVAAKTPVNLANGWHINTGTFAAKDTGLVDRLLSEKPCGIQLLAEGLQVDGFVDLRGSIPFQSLIEVRGEIPTSGSGVATCGCGNSNTQFS